MDMGFRMKVFGSSEIRAKKMRDTRFRVKFRMQAGIQKRSSGFVYESRKNSSPSKAA